MHLDKITALYEQRFKETDPAKRTQLFEQIGLESAEAAKYAIPNELDRFYSAIGGRHLNAHTSHEETVYKVSVPSNRFEQWAALEAERFRQPILRLFQPELEVVYEEKNRSLDHKFSILNDAVNKRVFRNHAYGQQTTIGTSEHLKNPSLANIGAYYKRHYVPANMALFISGDIDPDAALDIIEEHFSSWPQGPVPAPPTWKEEPLTEVERVEVPYPGEEFVLLAFRTDSKTSADAEALKLLDMILDNSTAGLINLNLNQKQKVRQAGSFPMLLNDAGVQYLWGMPKEGQTLAQVEALLIEQLRTIQRGEFDEWILEAIVLDYRKSEARKLEDNRSRVSMMREAFLSFREWKESSAEIARMREVTKDDIVRVAKQYFSTGYVAGYRKDGKHSVPAITKPKMPAVPIDPSRQSPFMKKMLSQKVPPIAPRFVDPTRDYATAKTGGVTVFAAKNPVNDLFSLSIAIPVGARHDKRLRLAQQLLEKSGAGKRTAGETAKEWYRLGTNFHVDVGDNETRITLSGLDERMDASLQLAEEALRTPNASADTLAMLVKIIGGQREDALKDQKTLEAALQNFSRYGAQSGYLARLPMAELAKLTPKNLSGAMSALLGYEHRVAYVGPREVADVVATLEKFHAPDKATKAAPEPFRFTMATPAKTEIRFIQTPMAQALVRIEQVDGVYDPKLIPEIELYNSYFGGGMNSIVFQELRESRALAYTARARYLTPSRAGDENVMQAQIGTQADKTVEAVIAFLELLDVLPESKERFTPARDSIVSGYQTSRVGFRHVIEQVWRWERLGLDVDPRRPWYSRVQSMGLDHVVAFQKSRLAGKPKLISIVGDGAKIGLEKLKALGTVIELKPTDVMTL